MASNSEVKVNVKADGAGFNRTMSGLEGRVRTFGSNIKGQLAAAFGAGALAAFARSVVNYAGNIKDAAEQLDVNPETAQGLSIIAKNAGAELTHLEGILAKVEAAKNDALSGNTGKADLFSQLGLSMGDLAVGSPVEILERLAKAYNSFGKDNPAFVTALGDLIGTKSMAKFRGMAGDLGEFQATLQRFRDSGMIIKDADIERLDEFGKAWERITTKVKAGAVTAMYGAKNVLSDVWEQIQRFHIKVPKNKVSDLALDFIKHYFRGGLGRQLFERLQMAHAKPLPKLDAPFEMQVPDELKALGITEKHIKGSKKGVAKWMQAYKEAFSQVAPYGLNPKLQGIPSDSLLSVGNFLGNRTSSMTAIASRTNELLADIKRVLYERLKANPAAPTATKAGSGFMP